MFTPEQIQKLEAVLRRARDDRDYCAELAEDPIAILKADADVELPSGARTRSVASDDVDFTIVLSAKPAATPESEPIVVVVDHAGDYEDDDLEPIAHLEAAIPRIVEKSNTDSAFRTALVSDPVGTLKQPAGREAGRLDPGCGSAGCGLHADRADGRDRWTPPGDRPSGPRRWPRRPRTDRSSVAARLGDGR